MTEIVAAHLERVAKQTAKLCAEDVNTINFNRGHVLGDIRGEYDHVMPTEEMAKVIEWRVAAALAACAREAKLEEAKWWHLQVALTAMQSEIIDPGTRDECRERIETLERAVGEKGQA